jgi:hypothetical protein
MKPNSDDCRECGDDLLGCEHCPGRWCPGCEDGIRVHSEGGDDGMCFCPTCARPPCPEQGG